MLAEKTCAVSQDQEGRTAVKLTGSVAQVLAGAILIFGIAGCTQGQRQIADPNKTSQIHKGSTKSEVRSLVGDPYFTGYAENGDETWSYGYLGPIRGLTAEAFGINPSKSLTVTFDKDGVVKAYSISGS
jgi:outer membrane protein assembly factor BamE (lipoprotein component of BamABCDE complex)